MCVLTDTRGLFAYFLFLLKLETFGEGPLHEDASWGRDADGVEQLRMPQGEFDQLPDLCELSLAAPDVVVADLVQAFVVIALSRQII